MDLKMDDDEVEAIISDLSCEGLIKKGMAAIGSSWE